MNDIAAAQEAEDTSPLSIFAFCLSAQGPKGGPGRDGHPGFKGAKVMICITRLSKFTSVMKEALV